MLPEELARKKIDKQLKNAGWDIVARDEYVPKSASAVKEALMQGNTESDYLLFVEDKAIAVLEAKKETTDLGGIVAAQAEGYAVSPQPWYGLWIPNRIPLVYLANGNKIYFKNMLTDPDGDYTELSAMHSPKKMLQIIGKKSEYGALPRIDKTGLRDCQYDAEVSLEASLKSGKKKALAVLATGSGKTYLACLASYRLLNYTPTKRILFLVDRNNLARQTESEFSIFDRTENRQSMSSLYQIKRLKAKEDISGDIVISTIQKLFAVLTGQSFSEAAEDAEDEINDRDNEKETKEVVQLNGELALPPDYFQMIIVDECHRSIYGKWRAVLDYFTSAKVLGLTATPTPEAYAFFDNNIVENYTYDDSVVDGVNVPARVYRIITDATVHGGTIHAGETIKEKSRKGGAVSERTVNERVDYAPTQLDRSVINPNQIESVLSAYKTAIYADLYPDREKKWEYIPKTLIFAKDDNHATEIVKAAEKVFADSFTNGKVPEGFARKITYSAGDSNALIRDLKTEKDFRIAVTVTLVATGTDVKPLEVVLFMNDVKSEVLYTQMKGRACRSLSDDKLKEVTPNAATKECFYIVDAVGVTEHDKNMPKPSSGTGTGTTPLSLEHLLEHLAHNDLGDDNLALLRDYCATINKRYEDNALFGRHLDLFVADFGFSPKALALSINNSLSAGRLPPFVDASHDNSERMDLIIGLIGSIGARKKLLEMQKGYYAFTPDKPDEIIYAGFSKESARSFIESFEKYLHDNKDSVEALRIIYNSEETVITYSMLCELRDKLISANRLFTPFSIWRNYRLLDSENVEELDIKQNVRALTHLIQLVRFAFGKTENLTSLFGGYTQRFNLYCGQVQRTLNDTQKEVMRQIAEYVINEGSFSVIELSNFDTDLWRKGIANFGARDLASEIHTLSRFILKVA